MADVDPAVAPTRPAARHTIHILKSANTGRDGTSGPTLDHLRAVATDAPTEAAHHAPDATFASERIREIPADLRSRPRWVAAAATFDVLRHPRSPKEEGRGRNPNTVPIDLGMF